MAAVGRLQRPYKRRPPPWREAGRAVQRAQAGEAGVDHPELAANAPGQLVALDVARDVAGAGQEAGVVPARRFELGCHRGHVHELPDLDRGADGQPGAVEGQAHRSLEGAEVGVEAVPLVADHHQLAGLVGGHQERGAELAQERGEVRRVHGPKRRRRAGLSGSRWPGGSIAGLRGLGRCLGAPAIRDLARQRHHPSPVAGPDDFAVLRRRLLARSTRGSSPGPNGDWLASPFPAKCQGLITAQTVPAGAGTAPDGPSAAAESNPRKPSQGTNVVAPVLYFYGSVIDLGPVEERVLVCCQARIIWCRLTPSQIEASLIDALWLLPDFRRIGQSLYYTPRGVGDRWW